MPDREKVVLDDLQGTVNDDWMWQYAVLQKSQITVLTGKVERTIIDREKVIKGLEICYCPPSQCEDCPYYDLPDEKSCNDVLCLDALALLKEQHTLIDEITQRRANNGAFD